MGHACNGNSCSNVFGTTTPDKKVEYTGPAVPGLGICTGDYLSEVEAAIFGKLIDYASGIGISIPSIDLTTCDAFSMCVLNDCCSNNPCTDLPCLLECYKNAICSIFEDLEEVKTNLNTLLSGPYSTGCISGLTASSTLTEILQKWLIDYCALKSTVSTIQTQLNTLTTNLPATIGNFLLSAITTCTGTGSVIKSGTGASASISFKGFVPIGGIIPYGGITAGKFDSTGLGLSGTDMCGFAMANGNNGTVNMTGLVAMGTTEMGTSSSVSGGSTYAYNSIGGEFNHLLTSSESGVGAHGHTLNEHGGHDHSLYFNSRNSNFNTGGTNNYMDATAIPGSNTGATNPFIPENNSTSSATLSAYISKSVTGITVDNSAAIGASSAHNNLQPYRALIYIQRIA